MKRQLKIETHQVLQMKEEMSYQEAVVARANLNRINAEKEVEILKVRLFD